MCLELEVTQEEFDETVRKVREKPNNEDDKYIVMLKPLSGLFNNLFYHHDSTDNKLSYFLLLWKSQTQLSKIKQRKTRALL